MLVFLVHYLLDLKFINPINKKTFHRMRAHLKI